MARLTSSQRGALPLSAFALPGRRAFPINDATHARLAISGATRAEHAGNISLGQMGAIKRKARERLKSGM